MSETNPQITQINTKKENTVETQTKNEQKKLSYPKVSQNPISNPLLPKAVQQEERKIPVLQPVARPAVQIPGPSTEASTTEASTTENSTSNPTKLNPTNSIPSSNSYYSEVGQEKYYSYPQNVPSDWRHMRWAADGGIFECWSGPTEYGHKTANTQRKTEQGNKAVSKIAYMVYGPRATKLISGEELVTEHSDHKTIEEQMIVRAIINIQEQLGIV